RSPDPAPRTFHGLCRTPLRRGSAFAASLAAPDQGAVVRGHGDVGHALQADAAGERIHRFEVADARARVAGPQPLIELAVAGAGVGAAVVERAVHREHAALRLQDLAHAGEESLDFR